MIKKLLSIINKIAAMMVIIAFVTWGLLIYIFFYYNKDLPDHRQLEEYNPPIVTRLYANNDKLLNEYSIQNRLYVPISAIPKNIINAFLAAEDKNFYLHPGVDATSIIRALISNILNYSNRGSLVGGSTITQQVVKNFLLTREQSIVRKIKEAILSVRISKAYSKDRILELYLNQIYLGSGYYGIASAALNYFNKSIEELSIEEIAYIAALPKAPSNYDVKKNYQKAIQRRNWVIDRMVEENFLSTEEALIAKEKPLMLNKRKYIADNVEAEFFAEAVRREISAKYGSKALYEEGLVIKTTLDPRLQSYAEISFYQGILKFDQSKGYRGVLQKLANIKNWQKNLVESSARLKLHPWKLAVILKIAADKIHIGTEDKIEDVIPMTDFTWTKHDLRSPNQIFSVGDVIAIEMVERNNKISYSLRQVPEVSGGLVAIEPKTGRILAMVGGFNHKESEFNRAIQAKRQPGSAMKPFVYLAALEKGYTPASLILDGPIEINQGRGLPVWKPKNLSNDYLGPTTLRRGLEKSRNIMTVRLAQALGVKKLTEVIKRFGISQNPGKNLSLSLGAEDTTLLDMTNAYAILVNYGQKITPVMIESIQDKYGKTIFRRDNAQCDNCSMQDELDGYFPPPIVTRESEAITDPATAYQMISMLEGVVQRGTGRRAKSLPGVIGGKTGTTNDSKDAWFIGFSPDIVVGTYVGYDHPRSLGENESGATAALPIFVNFMSRYLKNKPKIPFRIPKGIKIVRIDEITGRPTSTLGRGVIYEAFKSNNLPSVEEETEVLDDNLEDNLDSEIMDNINQDDIENIELKGLY
jgi:penicillin-binding protein 1A